VVWLETLAISNSDIVRESISKFWIVPAGVVALYFYGRLHFNTPDYELGSEQGVAARGSLLTLAPPIFTTYRSRFNRFALSYILILEAAFLTIVFLPSILSDMATVMFSDMATVMNFQLPSLTAESIQFRAVLGLFCLTGLLSSFPGFKDLDNWMLRKLHQSALIPDDARLLARQLFEVPFVTNSIIAANLSSSPLSRDTIRIAAERRASGLVENNLLKTLYLIDQLQHKIANSKYNRFKVKLERDLNDIKGKKEALKPMLAIYFKEQASIVPDAATDIDQYLIDNSNDPRLALLIERRNEIAEKTEDLLYRVCLVMALLVYATNSTPEAVSNALSDLGFDAEVHLRIMDWDAVMRVTGSVFAIMLGLNGLYALFVKVLDFAVAPAFTPTRENTLRFSIIATLFYVMVLMVVIKFKKHWRYDPDLNRDRPENILLGVYCYIFSLPFNMILALWLRGWDFSAAPFLFAVNQGVIAYFIGTYIDRSLKNIPPDWWLAAWQGASQAVTIFAAVLLSPPVLPPGTSISIAHQIETACFSAFQSGLAGFLVGCLFQYYYRRTQPASGATVDVGDISLRFQPRRA
jgi:hypothetical protein